MRPVTRLVIAERLALRSGIPFDQALKACMVIEQEFTKAFAGKAHEVWQRPRGLRVDKRKDSAVNLVKFGVFRAELNARGWKQIRFINGSAVDAMLNPNLPLTFKFKRHLKDNAVRRKRNLERKNDTRNT